MNTNQYAKQLRAEAARIGKAMKQVSNGELPLSVAVRAAKGSADLISSLCEGFTSGEIELVNDLPPTDEVLPGPGKPGRKPRRHTDNTDPSMAASAHP